MKNSQSGPDTILPAAREGTHTVCLGSGSGCVRRTHT